MPPKSTPEAESATVSYRVLPKGAGRISKGVHVPMLGDETYAKGDVVEGVAREIAEELEERGFVEIQ